MAKTKAKAKAKTKARSKAASKKVVKLSSKKPATKAKSANGLPKPSTKPYGHAGKAPINNSISMINRMVRIFC